MGHYNGSVQNPDGDDQHYFWYVFVGFSGVGCLLE